MDNSGLVLVAEQDPGSADTLGRGFELAGLKTITAASGQEALEILRQGAAALAKPLGMDQILDLVNPDRDREGTKEIHN